MATESQNILISQFIYHGDKTLGKTWVILSFLLAYLVNFEDLDAAEEKERINLLVTCIDWYNFRWYLNASRISYGKWPSLHRVGRYNIRVVDQQIFNLLISSVVTLLGCRGSSLADGY